MNILRTVVKEILGLFIDDNSFALAILVLLGIVWFAATHFNSFRRWGGYVLFAGLGLILIESCLRKARSHWTEKSPSGAAD